MSVYNNINQFSTEIDAHIEKMLREHAPFAADIAGYFFGWLDQDFKPVTNVMKGKRLRPVMSLLACEAICGSYAKAMPLAVAIELIHNYSLIHDDIADRDDERRGRPTVWRLWGDGLAINTGSTLYTLAFQAVTSTDATPQKVLAIHDIFVKTSLKLSYGQHWDITFERSLDVDQDRYLRMIDGKTAALIECATWVGALVATDDARLVDAYRSFGRHLGLAFQIQDDYLNIWIDTAESGKTQYSDLRNKKKSLPITYALTRAQGGDQKRLAAIYADADHEMTSSEMTDVLGILEKIDAKEYTGQLAAHHTQEAIRWLDSTELDNDAHNLIRALAQELLGRTV